MSSACMLNDLFGAAFVRSSLRLGRVPGACLLSLFCGSLLAMYVSLSSLIDFTARITFVYSSFRIVSSIMCHALPALPAARIGSIAIKVGLLGWQSHNGAMATCRIVAPRTSNPLTLKHPTKQASTQCLTVLDPSYRAGLVSGHVPLH